MSSELEQLLKEQYEAGRFDSSGSFTLEGEKALEKLAGYALSHETDWLLKVLQAFSHWRPPSLEVKLTSTETTFLAKDPRLEVDFESQFFDPRPTADAGFDRLREGLWSAGAGQQRPFYLTWKGNAYYWDGGRLTAQESAEKEHLELSVSLRQAPFSRGFLLRAIEAARLNAELLVFLRAAAHSCPMVVRIDGRRVDGLQFCPSHGYGQNQPLQMFWVEGQRAALAIPPSTQENLGPAKSRQPAPIARLSAGLDTTPPAHPIAAALLSAHLWKSSDGLLNHRSKRPTLFWVREGVVVGSQELCEQRFRVSLSIWISADGLAADLSGLKFDPQAQEELHDRVCRMLAADLEGHQLKVEGVGAGTAALASAVIFGTVATGGLATLKFGLAGFIGSWIGLPNFAMSANKVHDLNKRLAALEPDFRKLQKFWTGAYSRPSSSQESPT